jgi:hypothetical protein
MRAGAKLGYRGSGGGCWNYGARPEGMPAFFVAAAEGQA